jgi:hypothetical protein
LKPSRRRNHDSTMIASDFFNSIDPNRTLGSLQERDLLTRKSQARHVPEAPALPGVLRPSGIFYRPERNPENGAKIGGYPPPLVAILQHQRSILMHEVDNNRDAIFW